MRRFRGLEQVVNVRSHDSASRGDLNFQVGSQAHRTPKTVADSALKELRPAGRERLIVVEDDPVTRTMLAGYFSENNFDVIGASSCAECR
jgi:two-component system torCAD operon response regulator TorR